MVWIWSACLPRCSICPWVVSTSGTSLYTQTGWHECYMIFSISYTLHINLSWFVSFLEFLILILLVRCVKVKNFYYLWFLLPISYGRIWVPQLLFNFLRCETYIFLIIKHYNTHTNTDILFFASYHNLKCWSTHRIFEVLIRVNTLQYMGTRIPLQMYYGSFWTLSSFK